MTNRIPNIARLPGLFLIFFLVSCATTDTPYFKLHFIDAETGRGIPLVEIETNNNVRYVSDSAGWIALGVHDLASAVIYFSVESHGYELEPSDTGFDGILVRPTPGGSKTIVLQRSNVAERLYRVTGEGIYHDSQLLGISRLGPYPDQAPGGVFGQDSVVNAIYNGKLHWFWGDTLAGDRRLGNFKASGAVSNLAQTAQEIPNHGIELSYYVDERGFSRPMCPIEGEGAVWMNGLMVLEEDGKEQMLTQYTRIKDLNTPLERGIAAWNNETELFEKQQALSLDFPLYPHGHPIKLEQGDQDWFYFGRAFPNVRVRANRQDILDPKAYQAYTCLVQGSRWQEDTPPVERNLQGELVWAWKDDTDIITEDRWHSLELEGLVKPEEKRWLLYDLESGDPIIPHAGHVAWNEYRKRWIAIFTEMYGHSMLGEVWYAEAESPMGPWSKVQKIVTHNRYSFYNVKQHPYFAQGPYLYFEGTYSKLFSGNERPTPRYNYNQIMYRLNLDDTRLPSLAH